MPVHPGLRRCRWIGPHEVGVTMWQVQHEEMCLLLQTSNHNNSFAKIRLPMSWRMGQRHKHLLTAPPVLVHIILDDCVASGEPMFLTKPLEYPLGRMALFAVHDLIRFKPAINDCRKAIKLGSPDFFLTPVSRGNRKGNHLANTVTRYVEMARRLPLAHSLAASQTDLLTEFHGVYLLALLAKNKKGKNGRLLRRPYRQHDGATVV